MVFFFFLIDMTAYEKQLVIKDPKRLVLKDLPLQPGQRVTIRIIVEDEQKRAERARRMEALFKELQTTQMLSEITEDEIITEIANHRTSQNKT